ncbi:MAG: hypothetical protein EXS51_00600 [Candidatus Taylorbacteria bacterium]|nr:hypothetical protein [Candidatus Taylorbacteria bacterium]
MPLVSREKIFVIAILVFAACFSFRGLTTFPAFWFDEAINIQQTRSLSEQGYINLQTAPGVPYEKPFHLTTGYPVITPLSVVFTIFGFDFRFARLYMTGWILLFLLSAYLLARELFGKRVAFFSLLFLATFAPIYGNGETVIAEVPALVPLFFGAFLLSRFKEHRAIPFLAGLFLGLAAAVKPIYFLVAPALALSALCSRKEFSWKRELWLWCGCGLPVLLYIWTLLPAGNMFDVGPILSFYQNKTAGGGGVESKLLSNVLRLFTESSLLYTLLIGALLTVVAPWKKLWEGRGNRVILFLCAYGALTFLFFIQSIGWNRYLLPSQAVFLLCLPVAVFIFRDRVTKRFPSVRGFRYANLLLSGLVCMQLIHLFFFATIFESTAADEFNQFITKEAPAGNIYVVNSAPVAALVPTARLYQYFDFFEKVPPMPNLLTRLAQETDLTHLFVRVNDAKNVVPYLSDIETYYTRAGTVRDITHFVRKASSMGR